jgi:hypothetical protein
LPDFFYKRGACFQAPLFYFHTDIFVLRI